MTTILPDISTGTDAEGFYLRPRSAAGDAWLSRAFSFLKDGDATPEQMRALAARAKTNGLKVFTEAETEAAYAAAFAERKS